MSRDLRSRDDRLGSLSGSGAGLGRGGDWGGDRGWGNPGWRWGTRWDAARTAGSACVRARLIVRAPIAKGGGGARRRETGRGGVRRFARSTTTTPSSSCHTAHGVPLCVRAVQRGFGGGAPESGAGACPDAFGARPCRLCRRLRHFGAWGPVGVACWHWGVSGEGGMGGLLGTFPFLSPSLSFFPCSSLLSAVTSSLGVLARGGGKVVVVVVVVAGGGGCADEPAGARFLQTKSGRSRIWVVGYLFWWDKPELSWWGHTDGRAREG